MSLDDGEFESFQLCGHKQGLLEELVKPAATVQNVDFHKDSASPLRPCLQNYSNVPGSKLKWHEIVNKNVFRDCLKHVAMQRCHTAQWHDGLKHSGKTGMPFKTTSMENNIVQLHASLLGAEHRWIVHSGLPQNCSTLDTPWNFWGAIMAPLCSRTGLVILVPKERWRLSWTNQHYGQNLGSLIRTKLEMQIKWMEASWFSLPIESMPYAMCCKGDVHCAYDIDGVIILHHSVPRRYTLPTTAHSCSNTFGQHSGENHDTWWYRTPSFFMTMDHGCGQGITSFGSYLVGPGSIPDRVSFSGWGFSRVFPHL